MSVKHTVGGFCVTEAAVFFWQSRKRHHLASEPFNDLVSGPSRHWLKDLVSIPCCTWGFGEKGPSEFLCVMKFSRISLLGHH